ncbi:MAG: response regulator, partial [Chloroflexi bacterium]|nr:response regulator [Chloroflexota bacterium]
MAGKRIRLLLVDDHEVVRQGLRFMLDMEEDMEVVGGASSAIEALKLAAALRPDIVLVDIKVPPSNGLKLTRQLKEWGLAREVIILSLHEEYLAQAIEAGAGGYLLKGGKREELANAIRRVHRGEMFLAESLLTSPSLVEAAFRHFRQVVRWPRSREPAAPSPPGGQPLVPPPQEPAVTPPVPPAPPMGFPPLSPVPGAPSLPTSLDISWRMDAPAMPPPAESLLPPPFSPVLEHSGVGTTPTTAFPSAGAQELQWPDYPAKEADLIVPPPVDT